MKEPKLHRMRARMNWVPLGGPLHRATRAGTIARRARTKVASGATDGRTWNEVRSQRCLN